MIEIAVVRKKAVLRHTDPISTGNGGNFRVKFLFKPDDPVWENKALSASFDAMTQAGAHTTDVAPVTLDFEHGCIAVIPASVLRERAMKLFVGLHGTSPEHQDADTNMVDIGPVKSGAGGDSFFGGCGAGDFCCDKNHENWPEKIWHMTLAKLAGFEPLVRKLLCTVKKHEGKIDALQAHIDDLIGEIDAVKAELAATAEVLSPSNS